ncbi:MAG: CotH kinase family protein [Flavobacteriales bacterium]
MRFWIVSFLFATFFFQASAQLDHWETILYDSTTWKYQVPDVNTPNNWQASSFNDAAWTSAKGGFGFGDNDDFTILPNNTTVVFLRRTFSINDLSSILALALHIDYDDGYVAYLNGTEIARNGIPNGVPGYNTLANTSHEAQLYQNGQPDLILMTPFEFQNILLQGQNTLSLAVFNQSANSSDFTCRPFLSIGTSNTNQTYFSTPSWFSNPAIFASSTLPIVVLDTDGVNIPDEPKIDAMMGIINNGPGQVNYINDAFNEFYGQIAIEKRGSSSGGFPQQSYGLETRGPDSVNYNVSLFDWPADNDWILYAPYTDKALMRNVLTYKLGNEMGRWAPRTQFCEVILNGNYIGVYVLMERIKTNPGRVQIDQLNYPDTLDNQLTGGYIVKVDKTTAGGVIAWTSPYTCQAPGTGPIRFQLHDPAIDTIHPLQKAYIQDYITDWEVALKSNSFTDPNTGYKAYMDVPSFIDYFLISELSKNVDGYRISTFLHKQRFSEGGKLVAGPLWDYNIAWGNANYCQGGSTSGWEMNFNSVCGGGGELQNPFWWNRLLEDPLYANDVNCRWTQLRQTLLSDSVLFDYIDSMAAVLEQPALRHYQKWPILGNYVWPNNFIGQTYQEEVNYLKTWIGQRTAWMDANMFGICTANNSEHLATPIDIYPNPTSTLLTISGLANNGILELKDYSGKSILTLPYFTQSIELDLTYLSTGVYFITDPINAIHEKIIKQ